MTDATLPPQEPGPEPDTTTAAESDHPRDEIEPEEAPDFVEDDEVEDIPI
jgi:hypothetical protein